LRVGFGPFDFLGDQIGWIQQRDAASLVRVAFAHFAAPIREAHHPSPLFENQGLGHLEHRRLVVAKASIDALLRNVAGQFQVLFLVFADWHQVGVIKKDVGRHQHGVIQQPNGHVVALLDRLLLELDHPLQPVERSDTVQEPAELGMGRHMALHKHRAFFRINPAGQIKGRCAEGVLRQTARVVGNGDRVQIHDTEEGVVGVLEVHPVADGTQPVAQMEGAGGLDA